jgi:uncharacterized protein
MEKVKTGQEFSPSPQMKKLYYVYTLFGLLVLGFIWCWIMVSAEILPFALEATLIAAPFVLIPAIFVFWWIPKYWKSMVYKLDQDEMVWHRGVWFRKTGIVPYNRITNVDISQGPVSRGFRIASLSIQTAGYSGPKSQSSEIMIEYVENFIEVRDVIMSFVHGRKPAAGAVQTFDKAASSDQVLGELVKIRKLLEKKK